MQTIVWIVSISTLFSVRLSKSFKTILTSKSLPEIGRAFSNRDHTTVIHSVKTIERLRKADNDLNYNIDSLKNKILYNQENEI